ncbi:MAG: SBBP repeat-containing protein [Planctomycetota bacterium]
MSDCGGMIMCMGNFSSSSRRAFVAVCAVCLLLPSAGLAAPAIDRAWQEVYSSDRDDQAYGVSIDDGGNVYVAGYTLGTLGETSHGSRDAFVAKLLPDGTRAWERQFGTASDDGAYGVTCGLDGSIYVAGGTDDGLHGAGHIGGRDGVLVKYSPDGARLWTRQFGSPGDESIWSASTDPSGDILVVGSRENGGASDAIVTRFASDGTERWTWVSGIDGSDYAFDISSDGLGNVFVGGAGWPEPGYSDVYVTKLNPDGEAEWTKVLGTDGQDRANGIAADGLGNVYLSGEYDGGGTFLWKLNGQGERLWGEILDGAMEGWGLYGDADGAVMLGRSGMSPANIELIGYDAAGNPAWTSSTDSGFFQIFGRDLAFHEEHGYVTAGYTRGTGPNGWGRDLFVERYEIVPEPATLSLLLISLPPLAFRRRIAVRR